MLIYLQKVITSIVLPPGIFFCALLVIAIRMAVRFKLKTAALLVALLLLMWASTIPPVTDWMILRLTGSTGAEDCIPSGWEKGDVIIVLGGGVHYPGCDINGSSILSGDSAIRLLTAARIHGRNQVPIIVSGGKVLYHLPAESAIMAVYLRDLGVRQEHIIIEDRSKDTEENARYSTKICMNRGYKKPVLVTSAYHLKRAENEFKKCGIAVLPVSAGYRPEKTKTYRWMDYLPGDFTVIRTIMKESLSKLADKLTN